MSSQHSESQLPYGKESGYCVMSLILLIELLSVKACQKRESCCKLDAHKDNK